MTPQSAFLSPSAQEMFAVIVHTSQNSAAKWRLFFLLARKYVSVLRGPVSLFNFESRVKREHVCSVGADASVYLPNLDAGAGLRLEGRT